MDLTGAAEALPAVFTGGAGIGAGIFFIKWLFDWLAKRVDRREDAVDKTAAQVNEATQTLIKHLQDQITALTERIGQLVNRIDVVEAELEQCRQDHARDLEELARLRGTAHGLGDARQQAAKIVAQERVVDRLTGKISEASTKKD